MSLPQNSFKEDKIGNGGLSQQSLSHPLAGAFNNRGEFCFLSDGRLNKPDELNANIDIHSFNGNCDGKKQHCDTT